jgi:hypothetical protein
MSGKIDRRGFLKGSLMGVCGAALVPGISTTAPAGAGREGGAAIPALPGRLLGRTGITTPLISMGTADATSVNLIRAGYDAGVKLFFSAGCYKWPEGLPLPGAKSGPQVAIKA